ncbi:MAG TPA: FHA domain-containing protein, partial [Tepidisphaeraceae bacterium]|nr:FHA domain-containing protein [Tepidisphaeraceae bacterium]
MATKIVVRHLGNSSLAGQAAEFSGGVVKIGRREGNDIRYDANRDGLVSGNHAELRLQDGQLVIVDLGSSNGTYVNGNRIAAPTPVTPRDRISFGQGGPELLISLADAATPDATVVSSAPAFATQASAPVGAGYDLSAPMPAVKPFVGAPIPPDLEVPKPAAAAVQRPPSRASQQAHDPSQPKRTIGMNTLMGVLDSERGKERKKILTIVVPIILVLLIPVGWIAYSAWTRENVTTTVQVGGTTDWAPLFAKYEPSVYCVMIMKNGSVATPTGTAWAVAPGEVATNVHVAELFNQMKTEQGEFMFLRRLDSNNDIRIKSVKLHPGYYEAQRLMMKYLPFDAPNLSFIQMLPTADVATMQVAEADASKLGPPIPLASAADQEKVTANYEVAYIGYPSEGVPLNPDRPTSYQTSGRINRLF